jgi:hypothetical protein
MAAAGLREDWVKQERTLNSDVRPMSAKTILVRVEALDEPAGVSEEKLAVGSASRARPNAAASDAAGTSRPS